MRRSKHDALKAATAAQSPITEGLTMQHRHKTRVPKVLVIAMAAGLIGFAGATSAAPPTYRVDKVLIPPYELDMPFAVDAPAGFPNITPISAPVYKPHEVVIDRTRNIWVSANERG